MPVDIKSDPDPAVAFRREIEAAVEYGAVAEKALAQSFARLFIWRHERKDAR